MKKRIRAEVDTVNLIDFEEEFNKPSKFCQFSVKPSKYVLSQKIINPIKLTKGNINDHEPKKIICGYERENCRKIFLVEWYSTNQIITLPSFVDSEIMNEKHSNLIVEYFENIIANN